MWSLEMAMKSGLPWILILWPGVISAEQYTISTIAGGTLPIAQPSALNASIGYVSAVTTDDAGNVYFASSSSYAYFAQSGLFSVFKLDRRGVLTRVAGNGRFGHTGDGGLATEARLGNPRGLTMDRAGNLFIVDSNVIRRVSPQGIITTVAGGGSASPGDGGPATSVQLNLPLGVLNFGSGIAVDSAGNLLISELYALRKVSPSGIITTVQRSGIVTSVAVDKADNIFYVDEGVSVVYKLSPNGASTLVVGDGILFTRVASDGRLFCPCSLAVDASGNLFIAEANANRVRMVSTSGTLTTIAGSGSINNNGFSGDGSQAAAAGLAYPRGVAVDATGTVFIADSGNYRVRAVTTNGIINTVAGNGSYGFSGDGGAATGAQLSSPQDVTIDAAGNVFIADTDNHRVRKISPSGIITTVAGNGTPGFSGDGGPAASAELRLPKAVALDNAGNLFIADTYNHRVRKISPGGIITTVAGNGTPGFSGDGGPATNAELSQPSSVAVDDAETLFISDTGNYRVRKVSLFGGTISTIAEGSCARGIIHSCNRSDTPLKIATDGQGSLLMLELGAIRKIAADGTITTAFEGLGVTSFALDRANNLVIASDGRVQLEKVSASGMITPLMNMYTCGPSPNSGCFYDPGDPADGTPSLQAHALNDYGARALAVDGSGNVYFPDGGFIRMLRPTNQSVLISALFDAASENAGPVAPGKIVVIYGANLGPAQFTLFSVADRTLSTQLGGTAVSFNGIATPLIYTSSTQVSAIVPYGVLGTAANVTVVYQGQMSAAFSVPIAASAPSLFTANGTGAGQAVAINVDNGTMNTAANPAKIGTYVTLFATGEGQTTPSGVDGRLVMTPLPQPILPVTVTVGGIPAIVQYAGGSPGEVAGLMQLNVRIPGGVQPGGYVPVILRVGDAESGPGTWIAVAGTQ
jgi:uncharacterized protein (TIGR03437 family)